jgi:FtsP/CotA-like multicopper oxidase with cupredoxin domain
MSYLVRVLLLAAMCGISCTLHAVAAESPPLCPRPSAGAVVTPPPDLYGRYGVLRLSLNYDTRTDDQGRTLFCFETPDGLESPTLHVQPGDTLDITLTNRVPQSPAGPAGRRVMDMPMSGACGDAEMTGSSVNMHFHGMNISPTCHSDEVLHTVVNSGRSFHYVFTIPKDEPPGLYWYHPHIHGISAKAVFGGASGVIVVDGIQSVQPAVTGLPERVLVMRDQSVPGVVLHGAPNADVSLNYVPVSFPNYQPAVIVMRPGQREFWRVLNASADTIADLQLLYDGKAQPLQLVALDGVPTGSQDGTRHGTMATVTDILIPPAGRAEFIMTGPASGTATPVLVTRAIDTGPSGDADPARPLASLSLSATSKAMPVMAAMPATVDAQRFEGLDTATVTARRRLYFSEAGTGPGGGGDGRTNFFITVDGAQPVLYNPANPPAITTRQGAVEDWTIQNRSTENHEFHIHQIHFKLLLRDGKPVAAADRQMLDTVQVPYWSGTGPYPSVTLRMDFRGEVVGDFVYHCHILDHEDGGMMAIVRVLPKLRQQD